MHAEPSARTGTTTQPADLTWLLHRAAQRMRAALDQVARAQGLAGVRDWIVLSALIAGPGRTQLALGHALGLDKTTLTSLLDRLETTGLVVRSLDPRDRRARIPEVTTAGRRLLHLTRQPLRPVHAASAVDAEDLAGDEAGVVAS